MRLLGLVDLGDGIAGDPGRQLEAVKLLAGPSFNGCQVFWQYHLPVSEPDKGPLAALLSMLPSQNDDG